MLYLGTGSAPALPEAASSGMIGYLATPNAGNRLPAGIRWAADNGCFNAATFNADRWIDWLDRLPKSAMWATVPDVVADHAATLDRWHQWAAIVRDVGHRPAFVIQDGCDSLAAVPPDAEALFIGGSTAYKLSETARTIVQDFNGPTHMGRVNSLRRLRVAASWGVDSVDGTFLSFGPDKNLPLLIRYLRIVRSEPTLEGIPR